MFARKLSKIRQLAFRQETTLGAGIGLSIATGRRRRESQEIRAAETSREHFRSQCANISAQGTGCNICVCWTRCIICLQCTPADDLHYTPFWDGSIGASVKFARFSSFRLTRAPSSPAAHPPTHINREVNLRAAPAICHFFWCLSMPLICKFINALLLLREMPGGRKMGHFVCLIRPDRARERNLCILEQLQRRRAKHSNRRWVLQLFLATSRPDLVVVFAFDLGFWRTRAAFLSFCEQLLQGGLTALVGKLLAALRITELVHEVNLRPASLFN